MKFPRHFFLRQPPAVACAFALAICLAPAKAAEPGPGQGIGSLAELVTPLEIVVDRDPSRVAAAKRLARLHAERRDWQNAWRVLERSLPHAGRDAEYQGFAGTVLRQLKLATDATDAYRRAIALQPQEGRWWVGLGLALEDAGRRQEARQAFAAARDREQTLPPELLKVAERRSR